MIIDIKLMDILHCKKSVNYCLKISENTKTITNAIIVCLYITNICHSSLQTVGYAYCVVFIFCLRLVYSMLPVSLDCPFLIAPSAFSNVYFIAI